MLKPGIAGLGCALLDILHPDASFESQAFRRFRSVSAGDGGLVPGQLVFADALERFTGVSVDEIVGDLCMGASPARNLGGPAIVAMVLASQVLGPTGVPVRFFGVRGSDRLGQLMAEVLARTPLDGRDLRERPGASPSTRVLSDPSALGGAGERTFVNDLGVAERFRVQDIPAEFFDYEVAFFGGTALVPRLHADLGLALHSARVRGALTVVGTVFDFLNESRAPDELWPLGNGQEDYPLVDLIVADAEEARRLTGASTPDAAASRFVDMGAGAAVVTEGAEPVWFASSDGSRFGEQTLAALPVSDEVQRLAETVDSEERDTTGCGDNFMGGVLSSIAAQLRGRPKAISLREAVIEGICAGAAAWFQLGGTYIEPSPGAAAERLSRFREAYHRQIS